jgi:hypothetical protein
MSSGTLYRVALVKADVSENISSPCKIGDFHGGDYGERRLLGYKNPVRTSQETHYVSATEANQLMLCKN